MNNNVFPKKSFSIEQSIKLLESRGLIINDKHLAYNFLFHINYFRLSGYFFHFQDSNNNFKKNTNFKESSLVY